MTTTHQRYSEYVADQREFFDRLVTDDWSSYESVEWDRARIEETRLLFNSISASSVIDIGCGVGFHDVVMVERHGVDSVLGIDYSGRSVEAAERAYPHPKVRRVQADVFELSQGSFDLAVSFQVIEHLTNPQEFLTACRRQVVAGGHVAVFTPNRLCFNNRILRLRRRPLQLSDPQHFQEFTLPELVAIGAGAGLELHDSFGYGFSFIAPKIGRELVPRRLGLRLGRMLPSGAEGICAIFRVAPAESG